jgi:hypothetical protein
MSHMSQQQTVAVMMSKLVKLRSLDMAGEKSDPIRAKAPMPPKMAVPATMAVWGRWRDDRGGRE